MSSMSWSIDARIPLLFRSEAACGADEALLIEGGRPAPDGAVVARFVPRAGKLGSAPHPPGCACCLPRGAAGRALGDLFLARARGEVGFFYSVVAVCTEAGQAEVSLALRTDPVVSARFRLVD